MSEETLCKVTITHIGDEGVLDTLARAVPELKEVSWEISEGVMTITIVSDDVGKVRSIGDEVLAALGAAEDKILSGEN